MTRISFRVGPQSLEQELPVGVELEIGRSDAPGPLKIRPSEASGKQMLSAPVRTLSQQHAVLRVTDNERVQVEDCGSTNGTYLRLKPHSKIELTDDSELLLGRELTIQLAGNRWSRDRMLLGTELERPEELVKYLRAQLGPTVDRVFISPSEQVERSQGVHQQLRLSLAESDQLIVQWHSTTQDVEAESWLRAVVSLYNSKRIDESSDTKSWDFTAVSAERRQALWLAKRVSQSGCTVLIRGATGTGKEVLANDLHNHSPRASRPFIAINCGAIHASLAESVLFGHTRGSFTGATDSRVGVFEQADGGTLFLDELGELPLDIQVKLLRVLETKRLTPVGSSKERVVDVRVIAATHRPLEQMIEQGTFREDLYYRLSTIQIHIPRLDPADVRALAQMFLGSICELRSVQLSVSEQAKVTQLASGHPWVGGIRELRNALERYTLLRMDNRSPEENWRWTMEASAAHSLSSHRPRKADAESKSPAAVESPTLHRAPASVPERTSLAIRKPIDNLLFLSILLDAVSNDPRVGISEIAERVSMTYQGVVNRLKALELRLDGPEMAQRIHNRMEEERGQIQPYADWLKHCLQLG